LYTVLHCALSYRSDHQTREKHVKVENKVHPNEEQMKGFFRFEGYAFLLGYFAELCGVYFVCYPLLVTVMFSGILGCIPGLGGRPRDVVRFLNRLLDERNRIYADFEIV
jgi:hypothetical protein